MKTLSNLFIGNFDFIEIGQVTICASPVTTAWKLTLPPNDGTAGQFLTTDGNGITTWTTTAGAPGTVTNVEVTVPSQLTISGTPITNSGTFVFGLNSPTGTGNIVLETTPTLTTPKVLSGLELDNGLFITTLNTGATSSYSLTLPVDAGTSGQVLSTNGSGVTSWISDTGSGVTSVGMTVPSSQLTVTPATITGVGIFELGLNSPTGNGAIVLQTSPTMTTPTLAGGVVFDNTSFTTTVSTAATVDHIMVLPTDLGSNTFLLGTDGAGNTSWQDWLLINLGIDTIQTTAITAGYTSADTAGSILITAAYTLADGVVTTNFTTADTALSVRLTTLETITASGGAATLSSVGINVPSFLTTDTPNPLIVNGAINILYNPATPLPVENGGSGSQTSTGTGNVVLSDNAVLLTPEVANSASPLNKTILNSQAIANYNLSFPTSIGTAGQVLTTDGTASGLSSWTTPATDFVTSVGMTVPSQLTLGGTNPITGTGSFDISLTSPTGTGNIVLQNAPSFTGTVSLASRMEITTTGTETARFFRTTDGDVFYAGTSLGGNTAMKIAFTGTTNSTSNYFDLGFFGGIQGTKIVANGNIEMTSQGGVGGKLLMRSAANTNTLSITNQANTDWTLSFPQNGGTSGFVLSTDGAGVTSWTSPASSLSVTTVNYTKTGSTQNIIGTETIDTWTEERSMGSNTLTLASNVWTNDLGFTVTVTVSYSIRALTTAANGGNAQIGGAGIFGDKGISAYETVGTYSRSGTASLIMNDGNSFQIEFTRLVGTVDVLTTGTSMQYTLTA